MHKVREFVAASGAGVYGSTLVLDDASYTYCLKIGDHESIYIFSAPDHDTPDITHQPIPVLPTFYSGIVRNGMIRTDYIPRPDGSEEKIRMLEFFKPTAATMKREHGMTANYQAVRRLAVLPEKTYFGEYIGGYGLESEDRTVPREFSQYLRLKPSNYTGRMQQLVQVVLGFGRIPAISVYEMDAKTRARTVSDGIQLIYDCRWHRSHGLVTAADGRQWVLEISQLNGVIAMLLPIYPESLRRLADSKDAEIQAVLEAFHGLPTGQGFPPPTKLRKAIAAGTILQLRRPDEMADFFALMNFSTMCGWTFNEAGTEAHNTGWYFGDDGMRRSCHYRLDISIGGPKTNREPGEPVVVAHANLRKVSEGRFFHGSSKFPPPLKFYEPLIGGLVSTEFLPAYPDPGNPSAYAQRIVCDATMFVYYGADAQLKLVNYYYNRAAESKTVIENNYEACMYVGSWTYTQTTGNHSIPAMFYTTDADDREVIPDFKLTSNTVGTDLGVYGPFISDHIDDIRFCDMFRKKYFRKVTETETDAGLNLSNSVIVPEGLRNGVVYTVLRSTTSSSTTKSIDYDSLRDPNWYLGYRSFYTTKPGSCYTQFTRKVLVPEYDASNGCAIDLCDNGPWAQVCDVIPEEASDLFHQVSPPPVITPAVAKSVMTTMLYTGTDAGNIKLENSSWALHREKSPNEFGDLQFMAAMHSSAIGSLQMYYSTRLNPSGPNYGTRGSMMADAVVQSGTVPTYNFVGVL